MKRFLGSLSAVMLLALSVWHVGAANSTITVSPSTMQGWGFLQETPTGSGSLVNGPGLPPLGTGSANLIVDNSGGVFLGTTAQAGTPLNAITSLQYSTFGPSSTLAVALQFDVDYNANDGDTSYQGRIVFEPYLNGTVVPNTWQPWSPLAGRWWSSRLPGSALCTQATPCTWSQLLASFPGAVISGGTYLKAGSGWVGGFNGNADALTIGVNGNDTTYDFEGVNPTTATATPVFGGTPVDADQCKDGGWRQFSNPSFRNQGDCVSFVQHGNGRGNDDRDNDDDNGNIRRDNNPGGSSPGNNGNRGGNRGNDHRGND
jgi:hypothetical protein